MTKQEFVDKVAQKANLGRRDAANAVDAFLDTVTETLKDRGEISSPASASSRRRTARPARASTRGTPPRR